MRINKTVIEAGAKSSGALFKLREHESDPYGGSMWTDCDKIFTSKKDALAHAGSLIDMIEYFDDEEGGEVPIDFRKKLKGCPDNGIVLKCVDMEGTTNTVHIQKIR